MLGFSLIYLFSAAIAGPGPVVEAFSRATSHWILKGHFTQTTTNNTLGTSRVQKGSFAFKRPDSFRWQLDNPHRLYVGAGKVLWIEEKDESTAAPRVFRDRQFNVSQSKVALLFIQGKQVLDTHFTLVRSDPTQQLMVLRPKNATEGIAEMTVHMKAGKQAQISRIEFLDELRNSTIVDFSEIESYERKDLEALEKTAKEHIESNFTYAPPTGTKVLDVSKTRI